MAKYYKSVIVLNLLADWRCVVVAKIRLVNMMLYGFHGTYEYERELGQKFSFDVEAVTKDDDVIDNDESNDNVHSTAIYATVKETVENKRFTHMRALAGHIADRLLSQYQNLAEVTVTARRNNATITGPMDYVEVEVTRKAK